MIISLSKTSIRLLPMIMVALQLAACGGGGGSGGGSAVPQTFAVSGSISGLTASGLVMANGGDTLTLAANATSFAFPADLAAGASYSVSVKTQPSGATCAVTSASGTTGSANVTNVQLTCTANTYSIGGSISGLTASGLKLTNGADTLSPAANATSFVFATTVLSGASYSVAISAQPSGETCVLANASGTVTSADVSNVKITCTANTYSVGGSITGLTATGLTLANGSDTLSVAANATTFTLPTALAGGTTYSVTVSAQPTGQTCTVTNGSGTIGSANVTTVQVACTTNVTGKQWSTAQAIETTYGLLSKNVVDASGNVTVVWLGAANNQFFIMSNRYTVANSAWGTPRTISNGYAGLSQNYLSLAIDNNGNVIVIWSGTPSSTIGAIYANYYNASTDTWSTETALTDTSDAIGAPIFPDIAFDANNNALAVWDQTVVSVNAGHYYKQNLEAARYIAGTGWQAEQVVTSSDNVVGHHGIAIDAAGNATVLYNVSDASNNNVIRISAMQRSSAGAWSSAQIISPNTQYSIEEFQLTGDASGDAIAIWAETTSSGASTKAMRHSAGTWGAAQTLEADLDNAEPRVVMDTTGSAWAVWSGSSGVVASHFTVSGGWSSSQVLDAGSVFSPTGGGRHPAVALDSSGNAQIIWDQPIPGNTQEGVIRCDVSANCAGAQLINQSSTDGGSTNPSIVVDGNGNATATWTIQNSSQGPVDFIWASRYQ